MGFPLQTLALLLIEHRASPLRGPLLTLGKQSVDATRGQMLELCAKFGYVSAQEQPGDLNATPTDTEFFRLLGVESLALDVSTYEGAEIIHNLNEPVPQEMKGRFATIIDGGTLEHVFDIRQGFKNVADMLAPQGRVFHLSPCNNFVNHGFWQLSPTAFFDYYETNGFTGLAAKMLVSPRRDVAAKPWNVFPYDPETQGGMNSFFNSNNDQLATMFSAWKTAGATSDKIPIQGYYRKLAEPNPRIRWTHFLLTYDPEGLRAVADEPYR
jgi:SAM-dependent methyltransferase